MLVSSCFLLSWYDIVSLACEKPYSGLNVKFILTKRADLAFVRVERLYTKWSDKPVSTKQSSMAQYGLV